MCERQVLERHYVSIHAPPAGGATIVSCGVLCDSVSIRTPCGVRPMLTQTAAYGMVSIRTPCGVRLNSSLAPPLFLCFNPHPLRGATNQNDTISTYCFNPHPLRGATSKYTKYNLTVSITHPLRGATFSFQICTKVSIHAPLRVRH